MFPKRHSEQLLMHRDTKGPAPAPSAPSFDLTVDDVAFGGRAVGRHDGKVCFVAGALPGERVRVRPIHERDAFTEAELLEVIASSPDRIVPACPLALSPTGSPQPSALHPPPATVACPGCSYQHAAYPAETALKQRQLESLLERHAGVPRTTCRPPVAAPVPLGYRNKMVLHAQLDGRDVRVGYFANDNTTVIDVPACPLAMAPLNACLAERRADPSFRRTLRDGMAITFRWTARDGALWWRGQAGEKDVWLVESSVLGPLSVPRNSFYQMNPAVADLLVGAVRDRLAALRPAAVVDLFCGIGVFALAAAAAGVTRVVGVDMDGPGLKAAEYNARQRNLKSIAWRAGAASEGVGNLPADFPWRDTLLIVDPPRTGLGREVVNQISRHRPARVIYISCAADTMTRDAKWMQEEGYRVESSQLFDMFPRTAHFESVTEFARL